MSEKAGNTAASSSHPVSVRDKNLLKKHDEKETKKDQPVSNGISQDQKKSKNLKLKSHSHVNTTKQEVTLNKDLKQEIKKSEQQNYENRKRIPTKSSQQESLPEVVLLRDSTLSGIDSQRLGRAYNLRIESCKTPRMEDATEELYKMKEKKKKDPDIIMIHCGGNDIRSANATSELKDKVDEMAAISIQAKDLFPHSQIVIGEITPVRDHDLAVKRRIYNAHLAEALDHQDNISCLNFDDFSPTKAAMRDNIHPNAKGSGIIAGILGRRLRNTVWSHIPSLKNRQRSKNFHFFQHPYQEDNFWSNKYYYLHGY